MPHYLTGDGAVNWRPASLFEPSLNSTLVLAVKGEPVPPTHQSHLLAAQIAERDADSARSVARLCRSITPAQLCAGYEQSAPRGDGRHDIDSGDCASPQYGRGLGECWRADPDDRGYLGW